MKKTFVSLLALALLPFLAPPGLASDPPPEIDWGTYYTVLPEMRDIFKQSNDDIYKIHDLVASLEQSTDEAKNKEIRGQLRTVLETHKKLKLKTIAYVDQILRKPAPERTDAEALRTIRNTSLTRVNWDKQFLKYVVRDLSQATGIPMRLSAPVQELDQVNLRFPEVSAEGAINLICQNFGLKWIIFHGEVTIFRALNRNEERFLEYEKKHGKVDWIAEDKKSTYDTLPTEEAKRKLEKVENMDLPLLEGNLTKLYILEGESGLHGIRLKELEMASKPARNRELNGAQTEEEKAADLKRRKHIVHYLYMERDNAIEVWSILNQVLGVRLTIKDDNAELHALLAKEIKKIDWHKKDLEEALKELGRMVNVPVEVDLPSYMSMTISLTVDNTNLETALGLICSIQPLDWSYTNGKLFFVSISSDK